MAKQTRGEGWELIPARPQAAPSGPTESAPPASQTIVVQHEKRARGKGVTVARGFRLLPDDLKALAKQLKNVCGAGGTAVEDAVEVQGDHREKVAEALRKAGYQVRVR